MNNESELDRFCRVVYGWMRYIGGWIDLQLWHRCWQVRFYVWKVFICFYLRFYVWEILMVLLTDKHHPLRHEVWESMKKDMARMKPIYRILGMVWLVLSVIYIPLFFIWQQSLCFVIMTFALTGVLALLLYCLTWDGIMLLWAKAKKESE